MVIHNLEPYLLAYLLNSLWQVPLLCGAGWLAARVLRPAGAAVEHRVWVTTLWLQSLLPAVCLLPGSWLRPFSFWAARGSRAGSASVAVVLAGGMGGGVGTSAWLTVIIYIYAAVCGYFIVRFICRGWTVRTLRRDAVPLVLSQPAAAYWEQCCCRFRVREAAMATSSRIAGPVTMGFRSKLVLLPVTMADTLCVDDLHTVIAHECAHMRREDFSKNLLYEWLSLPIAYHPCLWLTHERIVQTREMACDQMAAGFTGRSAYARSLLRLASLVVNGAPVRTPHTIGIFDAHAFERRLMSIHSKQKELRGMRRVARVAAGVALTLGACGVALALSMPVEQASGAGGHGTKAPKSLDVSAEVMSKNLLTKAAPVYPPAAKKAKIEGNVALSAVIGKDGMVKSLRVLSGPKELQQSSLDAVRQWTYKPFLLNGDPIEVKTTIHIIYSLAG